jgi:hypothetical protein
MLVLITSMRTGSAMTIGARSADWQSVPWLDVQGAVHVLTLHNPKDM